MRVRRCMCEFVRERRVGGPFVRGGGHTRVGRRL